MSTTGAAADSGEPGLVARYGQLCDEEPPGLDRIGRLVDLLIEVLGGAGVVARRVDRAAALGPAVTVVLDGVTHVIQPAWLGEPLDWARVEELSQMAGTRLGIRPVVLSLTGYTPEVMRNSRLAADVGIVLLDRLHVEAILCGLASPVTILTEAAHRAVFSQEPYTSLTEILIGDAQPVAPAQFLPSDRQPAPWPLLERAAVGVQVRHLLSGYGDWAEPLGLAIMDADRALVTVADGIVEVDLKRGTSDWLLPLAGCRGTPLVTADRSVLTLCHDAVIRWQDGVVTPIGGGFGDGLALLSGPDGEPWVLSGHGAAFGPAGGTLALTRLGRKAGQQHRHHIHFSADVHTAGWLSDLRFFLAASGHSAVVDLARSTGVRRDDWIETPSHRPGHLVVVNPHTVITASPDPVAVRGNLYRTDITARTSELVAEIATNRVNGLAADPERGLVLLGDVRGNDVRVPRPVLVAVRPAQRNSGSSGAVPRPLRTADLHIEMAEPPISPTALPIAAPDRTARHDIPDGGTTATVTKPGDPYDVVRTGARGSRRDYALDRKPIASGGQASVFGATHKASGIRVAFKKLDSQWPDDVARMRREVEAAQLFGSHSQVMPILDFSPTYDWFVMPLVSDTAQTLAPELSNDQVLRDLVTAICDALREPHRLGWIHRDLKPDNVLNYNGRWVVADWGLGRRPRGQTTDPRRTRLGGPFGTEGFAAPELSIDAHAVGPQADIYSIGQIIGWAQTGRWPRANVPLLPSEGAWLTIAKAATQLDPDRRPASVDALLNLIVQEFDAPPEIPANRGEQLLSALRAGEPTALGRLIELAAQHPGEYDLYLEVLANLDSEQTRAAVAENPVAVREVVRGVPDLHSDAGVTLEYGDVDKLVPWLLVIAQAAESLMEWDLLEDAAESIFYLDHWDRWHVQGDIRTWLASRSGHAASIVAASLMRNPDIIPHFAELTKDRRIDHRLRRALDQDGDPGRSRSREDPV